MRDRDARRSVKRLVAGLVLGGALAADTPLQAQRADPHSVDREARRAVEGGRTAAARAAWTSRLRAAPGDRAAQLGLAALDELTYDHAGAAARFRTLSDTQAGPPDAHAAFARMAWARMDELRGAISDAESGYVAARLLARRAGDRLTESIVAASQAFLRANGQSLEAGLATLDTARRLLPADAPDEVRADLARRQATLLAVQLAPGARAAAAEAIRLARRAGDRRAEANGMRALALHHRMRSFPDSARAALDTTARLQRAARDRRGLSETLVRIANEYLGERRLGDARATLLEAHAEAVASRNDFALASTETGLGALALRVHDLPSAVEHLRRAEALNLAARDTASLVVVQSYQVSALIDAGMLDSAWSLQRTVLGHLERSNEIPELVVNHRVLANIALAQRRYDLAGRELDTAEALVRHHRIPAALPPLWFDRARLARRTGNDAQASALLTRYLASLQRGDGVARWDSEVQLAEIDARQGRPREAARRLAAATDALESWRAVQDDSTLRLLAFQASTHEASDRDAAFASVVAALSTQGEAASAFEQVERRRAQTLAERIVQAEALRASSAGRRARPPARSRSTIGDISGALPDDRTALLEYVTGGSGAPTTLFVVTRGGLRTVQVASIDSMLPAIRRFVAAIESGDDTAPLARALGAALLTPALPHLPAGVHRLLLVPDGALHRVPFDALRLPDGRAAIERFETAIVPSAAVAMLLWRRPPRARDAGARVLALGDPTFADEQVGPGSAEPAADVTRGAAGSGGFARLPASGREARSVARFGDRSVVWLREAASAASLKRAPLDSFSVLHLATHAVVDERSLARSAIVLAPGGGESGLLSPGDLAALSLDVDVVVLSACRSAGGAVVNGEGVQGLTAPLLGAGARAVVATGWPVDDRETVAVVEDFYRALARGEPVGAALRAAKLDALRRGAPVRDWASFSVVGDSFVRVPLRAPRSAVWIAAAAGAGVLAAAGWWAARRRARRAGA